MKQVLGYFLGFAIFIVGIPVLMWLVSGMPTVLDIPQGRMFLGILLALFGLSLSIWSIVYMKRVGKGNPFDAMGHEVAPRTSRLMTDGPCCREPISITSAQSWLSGTGAHLPYSWQ